MAYYGGWILLVILSIWTALAAFVWAVRAGQFSHQGRAGFLPLIDSTSPQPAQEPIRSSREGYALLLILGLGALGMLSAVILSIYHMA